MKFSWRSRCLFTTRFSLLLCDTSVTLAQIHCVWMTEVSICLNERGCRHTGVFDGTQPRCRWWLLFTEVFMSDMQKMIQRILTAPCQLSHRTFWEIDHIFSYRQEVCSFCAHPLFPKPIVFFFFTFYKLANCLIASRIIIMWIIWPLTAENGITFLYPHLYSGNETEQCYLVPPLDTSQTMSMGLRNPTEVSN